MNRQDFVKLVRAVTFDVSLQDQQCPESYNYKNKDLKAKIEKFLLRSDMLLDGWNVDLAKEGEEPTGWVL